MALAPAVVGSLPDIAVSVAADQTANKTVGTVGPFTVRLQCENQGGSTDYWDTSARLLVQTPGIADGFLLSAYMSNWEGSATGVRFGTVDMPGVGKIGIVANINATKTSCSASNIKTYLS